MAPVEEKLLLARFADLEKQAERGHKPCFSRFLDPGELRLFSAQMRPRLPFLLWGGYPDAERKMLGFFPDYMDPEPAAFPLQSLRLRCGEELGHRTILGSLMGLGIERNLLGDIAMEPEGPVLFCAGSIADFITMELTRCGRAHVKVSAAPLDELSILPRAWVPVSGTVASLRIDCVLGLLTGASRSDTDNLIRRDAVSLNHQVVNKPSTLVAEGDVLSVRGFGRAELLEIGGETKKGRMRIVLKKYI
ncbi:MAG: hypothetical protein E7402_05335 [Ruminococcaceae bacterium]|nr:hypothetical protein [Oscillospiraceae bacterium]